MAWPWRVNGLLLFSNATAFQFLENSLAMPKKLALPWHKHWDKHWLCKAGLGNGLSGHVLKTAWQGLRNGLVMSQGLGKALAMPWQCFGNALAIPWQWAIDWHCLGTSTSYARPRLAISRNFLGHVLNTAWQWLCSALAMS